MTVAPPDNEGSSLGGSRQQPNRPAGSRQQEGFSRADIQGLGSPLTRAVVTAPEHWYFNQNRDVPGELKPTAPRTAFFRQLRLLKQKLGVSSSPLHFFLKHPTPNGLSDIDFLVAICDACGLNKITRKVWRVATKAETTAELISKLRNEYPPDTFRGGLTLPVALGVMIRDYERKTEAFTSWFQVVKRRFLSEEALQLQPVVDAYQEAARRLKEKSREIEDHENAIRQQLKQLQTAREAIRKDLAARSEELRKIVRLQAGAADVSRDELDSAWQAKSLEEQAKFSSREDHDARYKRVVADAVLRDMNAAGRVQPLVNQVNKFLADGEAAYSSHSDRMDEIFPPTRLEVQAVASTAAPVPVRQGDSRGVSVQDLLNLQEVDEPGADD
uniref:Uncharacterized protein n=1 Tax=Beihai barnacle virus 14 TaxID=1922358 RepID=A0A1L3KL90_9VIRU|nr:hypothetical protein [Beihai barnacle virus 14]